MGLSKLDRRFVCVSCRLSAVLVALDLRSDTSLFSVMLQPENVQIATLDEHFAVDSSPGDVVLLAPACASFDQFKSYEHRGRLFKDVVRGLAGAGK